MKNIKKIWERLIETLCKLFSIKGIILILATWFRYDGKLDQHYWFLIAISVAGIRALEKKFLNGGDKNV